MYVNDIPEGSEASTRIAQLADDFFREKHERPFDVSLDEYLLRLPEEEREAARSVLETAELLYELARSET